MSKPFLVNLSDDERIRLRKRAAMMTLKSGARVSESELIRMGIALVLSNSPDSGSADGESKQRVVKLIPAVDKAIRQASLNSGRSADDIINGAVVEALQLQEVA